jgi:hypothetical protein
LSQPLLHLHFNLFVISETFATKVFFLAEQTVGSHWGPNPGCKADVQEVPTVVLEFSPGLFRLYGVQQCHDEAVPLLPVGLEVFCELHSDALTELHSMMQNSSHFHHAYKNGLTLLPENPNIQ